MNICFIQGYLMEDVNYNFVLSGKNDAIATFTIKVKGDTVAHVIAYNEEADFCYRKLKKDDMVLIMGKIDSYCNILLKKFYKIV